MKRASSRLLVAIVVAFGGAAPACGDATTLADGAAQGPLPAACQALLDGLWLCASRLPAASREPLQDTIAVQRQNWLTQAKAGKEAVAILDTGCREALEQVRSTTRETCAGIAWAPAPNLPLPAPKAAPDAGTSPDAAH